MADDSRPSLVVVIMAGGIGTRFWPLSTRTRPKQFLKLFGERSLFQRSYDRVAALVGPERILVLTNQALVGLVREQLPQLPEANLVGEPMRRDTAAAVCLGALLCRKRFGDPVIATLTADHLIEPSELFQTALLSAVKQARASGALYTFGVRPSFPATGYGYLEMGEALAEDGGVRHLRVARFREKPDLETARSYLASRRHFWNSGMFVWSASAILRELEVHLPDHARLLTRAVEVDGTPAWPEALRRAFEPLPTISVDFAVMEKAADVRCAVAGFAWSDVGGWPALREFLPSDGERNAHRGRLHARAASGNLVYCENQDETVILVGVDDLIVVRAGGRTLVVHKDRCEDVKQVVQSLGEA